MPSNQTPESESRYANFKPGTKLADRYTIIRIIAKGGMGMVYLAKDHKRNTHVALKTILPKYLDNEMAKARFIREIEAIKRLDHNSVVRIHDTGRIRTGHFFTMEFVQGRSVRSLLVRRKKIGFGSTVRIVALLCEALEHVHQETIHRDISPENIIVRPDGSIKLIDFGLAKLEPADGEVQLTRVGVKLGKIMYSAPEQRTDAGTVDLRADIYSVGILFFEMITGDFDATHVPITQLAPELPIACNDFVRKATATNPDDRFQTARELGKELLRIYRAHSS